MAGITVTKRGVATGHGWSDLPHSVFSASPGPAPGNLGWGNLPQQSDYLLRVVGTGIGAVNAKTGNTDYSTPSGDHGAVIQSAINALTGQTKGGMLALNGVAQCSTQIVMPPGIALVGQGPLSAQPPQANGAIIQSTFNGSALLIQGNAGGDTFSYVGDIVLRGSVGLASQNGIEINDAAGAMKDVVLRDVLIFQMGQHGLYVNSGAKVFADLIYLESCTGDGLRTPVGGTATVDLHHAYIFGNTGNGIGWLGGNFLHCTATEIWNNGQGANYGLDFQIGQVELSTVNFQNNGFTNNYQVRFGVLGTVTLTVAGCPMTDSRGASAVNRHILFTSSHACTGNVMGSPMSGQKSTALFVGAVAGTKLKISECAGFNDTYGQIATPFHATGPYIGLMGSAAAPTASTAYTVEGCDLYCAFAGGTGVSITIKDPTGVTVQAGLTTFTGILPVGYSINFGAFSVAPATAYVGVV